MSIESTARTAELKRLGGWSFCPMRWKQVQVGDTILASNEDRRGETRYVVHVEQHYATAIVAVMNGAVRQCAEKNLDDAVHVLVGETDDRLAAYLGEPVVRQRRGRS
jgi:hypothetical protein